MTQPIDRSPKITNMLSKMIGTNIVEKIENDICVLCHKPVGDFKDEVSRREYRISGLCQKCQDDFFEEEEE